MIENIIKLTNKYFFVTTPNRFFPIDFHTKLPIIHMFPKKIHRKILRLINLKHLILCLVIGLYQKNICFDYYYLHYMKINK